MQFVAKGRYQKGSSKAIIEYVFKLCNASIGNCHSGWFTSEFPRRIINVSDFCIDRYEYPNIQGRNPSYGVSWTQANRMCIAQGKRLCTENEWEKACGGSRGDIWTFGDKYNETACNVATRLGAEPSGIRPKCVSPYGAYDMSGNLSEWTSSTQAVSYASSLDKSARLVKGGSWKDGPLFTRCAFTDSFEPDTAYNNMGFRCCWPATVEAKKSR